MSDNKIRVYEEGGTKFIGLQEATDAQVLNWALQRCGYKAYARSCPSKVDCAKTLKKVGVTYNPAKRLEFYDQVMTKNKKGRSV